MKTTREEKKKEILNRIYGGDKPPVDCHDFSLKDGKCKKCGVFIGDAEMLLCPIISVEEINNL